MGGGAAFLRMRKIFGSHDLALSLRVRMNVFSVLLYGIESWRLTEAPLKRIKSFEMWVYRRLRRISWKDRVTNKKVLRGVNKNVTLTATVKRRKLEYFDHDQDKCELLHFITQGKIDGRRGPGRRRISWLNYRRQWFGQFTAFSRSCERSYGR